MLTAIQRGAFGGLLPIRESVGIRLAKCVAQATKPACCKVFVIDDSDNANNAVKSKGKIETLQSADGQVCLRCSKRLHLAGELTTRGKTVPLGFRCDLSRFCKYSFCTQSYHNCKDIG